MMIHFAAALQGKRMWSGRLALTVSTLRPTVAISPPPLMAVNGGLNLNDINAFIANRLSLSTPVGLGTRHFNGPSERVKSFLVEKE